MSTYEVRTTSMNGALQSDLAFANPTRVTKLLNEPFTATFRFPMSKYAYADVNVFDFVQIYRNGDLLFFGMIWDITVDSAGNECVASCGDFESIFARLNLDKPKSNNLTNGSFETGTTAGWFNNTPGIVTTVVSSPVARGDFALRLQNSSAWTDRSWQQTVSYPASIDRRNFFVSGYFRLAERLTLANTSFEQRGLYMQIADLATGDFIRHDWVALDNTWEPGVWHRAPELRHTIDPGVGRTINVRLYAPGVTIYWDEIAISRNEPQVNTAGGPGSNEDDITNIIHRGVDVIQSVGKGKTNLGVGTAGSLTGITEYVSIPRYQHLSFDQFVAEYHDRNDGVDTAVQVTPTTKTYRVWPDHGKGVDRSGDINLTFGDELAAYSCVKTGSDTSSRVTIQAPGDGADREEAEEADTTFTNGLTLQEVRSAVEGSRLKSIDQQAKGVLRRSKRPVRKWDLVVRDRNLVSTISVGDTVHLTIDDGWMQANLDVRVIAWDLDCVTDLVTLTAHEPAST